MAGFIQLPKEDADKAGLTSPKRFEVIRHAGGFEQQIEVFAANSADARHQAEKLFAHRKAEQATYTVVAPDDENSWFYAA